MATYFHFSYHKCLTMYYRRVMMRAFGRPSLSGLVSAYEHAASKLDRFEKLREDKRAVSLNNHFVPIDSLGGPEIRVSRFIRDPRDLLVSGYFYHRRGAEPWCNIVDPTTVDWVRVNGTIPSSMPRGVSFSEYLQSVSLEEGMMAELEFRTRHFESMARWPMDDPRVLLLRYEEIVQDDIAAFDKIFTHYEVGPKVRHLGMHFAKQFSSRRSGASAGHMRDPRAGQWRETIPSSVLKKMEELHGEILDIHGYAR